MNQQVKLLLFLLLLLFCKRINFNIPHQHIAKLLAIVTWLFSESPQFNKTKYLETVLSASCNSYFSNSCHTMIVNAFPLALIYLLLHHSIVLFGITFDTLTYNITYDFCEHIICPIAAISNIAVMLGFNSST